jgi:hypothetical protein
MVRATITAIKLKLPREKTDVLPFHAKFCKKRGSFERYGPPERTGSELAVGVDNQDRVAC